MLYAVAVPALLYRHRWMWSIYVTLCVLHVAVALAHGAGGMLRFMSR